MKIIFLLISLMVLLNAKVYKVGFAQDTLLNDWRKAQVEEVRTELGKYPNFTLTVKDANAQVANQIADIEYFIKNNYDFIITSPRDPNITSLVLKKAIAKGIKVILLSRSVYDQSAFTSLITTDNEMISSDAAKYMAKKLNGKGTILMFESVQGNSVTLQRTNGFMKVMKNYPNIKVIKYIGNSLRSDAIKEMEKVYKNNIHFDAIYSHSDSMLSGIRLVMKQKHKLQDLSKLMVGIDYIKEAQTAIINGEETATFKYKTASKEGVQTIVDIINGKPIKKINILDTLMIDKSNVNQIQPIF